MSSNPTLADYEIYEEIGRGRHSIVYRGRRHYTLEFVAVKSIDKQHSERIKHQVSFLKQMSHSNVMAFYTWYQTPNNFWVCSEYCAGGNLCNLLKQEKQLPEACLRSFARDIACGLQYVNSRGVIYCDLKPSNILLTEYAVLKLCDFGLARSIKEDRNEKVPRSKRGTPHYMSPEQFDTKSIFSFASDIWSFGCVLHEMACGLPPFPKWPMKELIYHIRESPVPPMPSHLSQEFVDLVNRCLIKNPAKRITWPEICNHPFWKTPLPVLVTSGKDEKIYRLPSRSAVPASSLRAADKKPDRSEPQPLRELNTREQQSENTDPKKLRLECVSSEDDDATSIDDEDIDDDELLQTLRPSSEKGGPLVLGGGTKTDSFCAASTRRQTISHVPSDKNTLTIQELMEHECDVMVRPLVGNVRIEKPPSLSFSGSLPFNQLSLDDVLSLSHTDLERFLKDVYRSLDRKVTTVNERLSILKYFIPLCTNTGFANCIINSGIMSMFIQQASAELNSDVKLYFIYAMGTLIRYASIIGAHLCQENIFETLSSQCRQSNVKVRRQAMATLGELLFYVATRDLSEAEREANNVVPKNCSWQVPASAISTISRALRAGEDDIVRHYAAKTIENVAAQSPQYLSQWFFNTEIVLSLVQIFQSSNQKSLRITCAAAMSQTLRCSHPNLFRKILPRIGWLFLIGGLELNSPKCQQAFFNLLIFAISNEISSLDFDATLLVEYSIQIIENTSSVIRAKALLTLALLFTHHKSKAHWISLAFESKIEGALDKASKDKDPYTQKALLYFFQMLTKQIQLMFEETFSSICTKSPPVLDSDHIGSISVILKCATDPLLVHIAITPNSIRWLSGILSNLLTNSQHMEAPIIDTLYIIESLSANPDLITIGAIPSNIVEFLLPSLISVINIKNRPDSADCNLESIRFFCIKLVTDILAILLPSLYDRAELTSPPASSMTLRLHSLMIKDILPIVPNMLAEKDPIPQYCIRLSGFILDANPDLVKMVKTLGLVSVFVDMLSSCDMLTLGNVKIVHSIVLSGHVDLKWLYNMGLVPKLNTILCYSFGRSSDLLSGPILDIMQYLLTKEVQNHNMECLVDNMEILLSYMLLNDNLICDKAISCINLITRRFPNGHQRWVSSSTVSTIFNIIKSPKSSPSAISVALSLLSGLICSTDGQVISLLNSKDVDALGSLQYSGRTVKDDESRKQIQYLIECLKKAINNP